MGVIAEYQSGACHIKVFDDSFVAPEEVNRIIGRVSQLVYNEQLRLHMQENNAEMQERDII